MSEGEVYGVLYIYFSGPVKSMLFQAYLTKDITRITHYYLSKFDSQFITYSFSPVNSSNCSL